MDIRDPEVRKKLMEECAKKYGVVSYRLSEELKYERYPQEGSIKWMWYGPVYSEVELNVGSLGMVDCIAPTMPELILKLLNCPQEVDTMYKLSELTADMLARRWLLRKKAGLL